MKNYSSREIIKALKSNGWYLDRITRDHYQFKHPELKGIVTVPHPRKDVHINTLKSIEKQSGIKLS